MGGGIVVGPIFRIFPIQISFKLSKARRSPLHFMDSHKNWYTVCWYPKEQESEWAEKILDTRHFVGTLVGVSFIPGSNAYVLN